ncbi:N-glycosylase/DNA lyase [candidate division WOR-3 bacterium]|nr:N-glycosylase/DNA lyase [candidate division WOR-3 bacterium]
MISEKNLISSYKKLKPEIEKCMTKFEKTGKSKDEDIFPELCFCLLTPQSNAKRCWSAVEELLEKKLLFDGSKEELAKTLRDKTRFHNCKAGNIVSARKLLREPTFCGILNIKDDLQMRIELVERVKGMGYKEASHFMRNIGRGKKIAILDRHVLRFLMSYKVLDQIPENLSESRYLEIEILYVDFSKRISIPPDHLDMLIWFHSTGEFFK